ncbi:C40 family peptidase [Clostridium lacusfryxellense]|uniref:C40 family peptidase n=1 Tax=Clostridium lacusfryxellense TaxID=205328 RepID=UPI001C0E5518|nr:C40 family peptidase [Clostridium lacusfryxellense]MBU3113216.1 C40 family peptidase [Clostridium lacusfryxellense]
MSKVKTIISFSLALLITISISINSTDVQAKAIVFKPKNVVLVSSKSKLTGSNIVYLAKQYIGTPYKRGGTTTAGFDCSGFTMYIYNRFKVKLPRTAKDQTSKGTAIKKSALKPGDLIFFGKPINHVGIYIGSGKFIHSPKPGAKVKILELKYMPGFNTARRITSK